MQRMSRTFAALVRACAAAALGSLVLASTAATPGLDARVNIGPYLNGSMPQVDPLDGGAVPVPAVLSQTAAFTDTPAMTPNPALVPYELNSPLWSDGSGKLRWLALPYEAGNAANSPKIDNHPTGTWRFPNGTAIVKHFGIVVNEQTNETRRLETRILIRDANGGVYGRSYRWRADNLDADVVNTIGGEPLTFTIVGPDGVTTRQQEWRFPGPDQCVRCHNNANPMDVNGTGMVLGLKTRQLNRDTTYPATGRTDNQLHTFNHMDMLANPIADQTSYPAYEKLSPLSDTSATFEHRIRSYVDANCAFCHQLIPDGPRWDARYTTPYLQQNIAGDSTVNPFAVLHRFAQDNSVMYFRDSIDPRVTPALRPMMMPPIARNIPHTEWLALLSQYINYPFDTVQAVAVGLDPTQLKLKFSRPLDAASAADPANYALNNGILVSAAQLDPMDDTQVILTVSAMAPGTGYRVSVVNVKESGSQSGGVKNPIWPNTWEEFTYLTAPIAQTISFASLPDKFVGDPGFTVAPTGGPSGNPVVVTSLTTSICTVSGTSGTNIALTGTPGLCTLVANQAGNATHAAAPQVTRSFKVLWRVNLILEGSQSAPPVVTSGAGSGTATYDATNRNLTLDLSYGGLGSAVTMAHIHGPAARGANAGILIDLNTVSPLVQTVTLDATQEGYLMAGQLYINVHTALVSGGEIRAQIDAQGSAGKVLKVSLIGTDANAVRTVPAGPVQSVCPVAPCTGTMVLPADTAVTLVAYASTGNSDKPSGAWRGCDSQTFSGDPRYPDATCTLTLNSSRAIEVDFRPTEFPSEPLNVSAIAGNGFATVSFTAPLTARGATITSYTVTCVEGANTVSQTGTASPIGITLSNGITYQCRVSASTGTGTGPESLAVTVSPRAPAALMNVKSRKTHRAAPPLSSDTVGEMPVMLDVPLDGNISVEPRMAGPAGHQLVFTFDRPVNSVGTITALTPDSQPAGALSHVIQGNVVIVTLTNLIAEQFRATVAIQGINGVDSAAVTIGFLPGDVNASGRVTAADLIGLKGKINSGQLITSGSNFLFDINLDGVIGNTDVTAVKARSGRMIP